MSNRTINIGLCGFGVVGQGVYDHLNSKRQALRELLGADMSVTRIAVGTCPKKGCRSGREFLVERPNRYSYGSWHRYRLRTDGWN